VNVIDPPPARLKAFPPGRRGVLLPYGDRRTAALGICLYTASKPWVVALQSAAYWYVRALGVRCLPGRSPAWAPPCDREEWSDLVQQWTRALGPIDGFAGYQRRQHDRPGLTLVATRSGAPLAVVKLREDRAGLDREQRALTAVGTSPWRTFRAPAALGLGHVGNWFWSAQQAVFTRPHRPVINPDPRLFEEVRAALSGIAETTSTDEAPAHRDLTPWNLRRDSRGNVWLFDWEDVGTAPTGSDRAYFLAAAAALGGDPLPDDVPGAAVAYCRSVIAARTLTTRSDAVLAAGMLAALDRISSA
jgi:hypothetical protein